MTKQKVYIKIFIYGGQNRVVGVTGIDLNGVIFAQSEEELFSDQATYDEMYHYKPDEENE